MHYASVARAALILLLPLTTVAHAGSGIPDPLHCRVTDTFNNNIQSITISLGAEYPFYVVVQDESGTNIGGSKVRVEFNVSGCGTIGICSGQLKCATLDLGAVGVCGTAAGGLCFLGVRGNGSCFAANAVNIYATDASGNNERLIHTLNRIASPDLNRDWLIDLPDLGMFSANQAANNLASDLNGDGSVGLADVGLFAKSQTYYSSDPACP